MRKNKEIIVNVVKEFTIKQDNDIEILLEKGDKIKIRESVLQGTFGFGGEAEWVEPNSLAPIEDKEKIEFEKAFSKAFEQEFGEVPSSDLIDKAVRYYRRNDEFHRDVDKDSKDIVQEIKENLDSLVEEINKEIENYDEYVTSTEYAKDYDYVIETFQDGYVPDDVLEKGREKGLEHPEDILDYLWTNLQADIKIEYEPSMYYDPEQSGDVVFGILQLGEQEIPIDNQVYENEIKNLTYEEYLYVRNNVNGYMSDTDDKRDWQYVYVDYNGYFRWFMDKDEALQLLDEIE